MANLKRYGTNNSAFSSYRRYERALDLRGYTCLGSGSFAAVYAKPGENWVIKVGRQGERAWGEEHASSLKDSYVHYLRLITGELRGNVHVPVVSSVRWYGLEEGESPFYVVVMERLIDHKSLPDPLATVVDFVDTESRTRLFDRGYERDSILRCFAEFWELPSSLSSEAARVVARAVRKRGRTDLHPGNVMFRKEGWGRYIPVLTDPFYGHEAASLEHALSTSSRRRSARPVRHADIYWGGPPTVQPAPDLWSGRPSMFIIDDVRNHRKG